MLKNNLYIGGINKINNRLVKETKEGIIINPNYKTINVENQIHDENSVFSYSYRDKFFSVCWLYFK